MTTQPNIYSGSGVDRYLKSQGAVAQAINRNTIFISSHLISMKRFDRCLVMLHELAHLQQLATPGNDPERALEEEAWEAAHSWSNGQQVCIRGRGRTRLNATAIIQGGEKGHPDAPTWYSANPIEPIGGTSSITVKNTVLLKPTSIDSILDQIIASKDNEILIVNHGNRQGLSLPLRDDLHDIIVRDTIYSLSLDKGTTTDVGGMSLKLAAKSDHDVAVIAKANEAQIVALRKKMNIVRSMQLSHVAFRACNMATDGTDTLEIYRDFFGAKSVSAPTEFDAYGHFGPAAGTDLDKWVKQQLKTGWNVWVDGPVAFATKAHGADLKFPISTMALRKDDFRPWIKAHISDLPDTNKVIFHGIKPMALQKNTDQSVFFVKDAGFSSRIVSFP